MKFSWKNIENWRSWKMRFFWGCHFEFSKSAILNFFFLLHFCEKSSPFIWGIIFFCTMDGLSRILEKKLSELLCTQLYVLRPSLGCQFWPITLPGHPLEPPGTQNDTINGTIFAIFKFRVIRLFQDFGSMPIFESESHLEYWINNFRSLL